MYVMVHLLPLKNENFVVELVLTFRAWQITKKISFLAINHLEHIFFKILLFINIFRKGRFFFLFSDTNNF